MTGEQGFFQIATGLIPVLLFGGFLFNRNRLANRSKPSKGIDELATIGVAALGFVSIVAEAVAISGAVGGTVSASGRLLVIAVILIGMMLIVLDSLTPRVSHLLARTAPQSPFRRLGVPIVALLFAASAMMSAIQIEGAIQTGDEGNRTHLMEKLATKASAMDRRLDERGRRVRQIDDEINKYEIGPKPADRTLSELERSRIGNLRTEAMKEVIASQQEAGDWVAVEHRIKRLLEQQ